MGRPPCCDIDGIKKGPWTPEEDIILASYIQEHGPGNWRLVPTNTGLLRCSKSCRLRWTNYLRPGIKRGNFTSQEERMIVHLQALLGNKWASIASYLPQRTDNDIKNYWNTHLKKKLKKFQSSLDPLISSSTSTACKLLERFTTDHKKTKQASLLRLNQASTYASSTENISRLLKGWMKSSPKTTGDVGSEKNQQKEEKENDDNKDDVVLCNKSSGNADDESCDVISHEELDSLLLFENMSMAWEKSFTESTNHESQIIHNNGKFDFVCENEEKLEDQPPFSLLEKWLLDESSAQQGELMGLSPIF